MLKPDTSTVYGKHPNFLKVENDEARFYFDEGSRRIITYIPIRALKRDTSFDFLILQLALLDKEKKALVWLSRLDNNKVTKSLKIGEGKNRVYFSSSEFSKGEIAKVEEIFENVKDFEVHYEMK